MYIERVTEINDKILEAFQYFIPELTNEKDRVPTTEDLERVISFSNNHLLIAKDGDVILGTLTLVFYKVPSGIKAWIEDVIVSDEARGKGVATALIWHAINIAQENQAEKVDLSSSPWREAANNLYLKLGFQKRDSNMYRLFI
ncbi:MAG: GNAT family N-acetyltransferase [Fermentimonas sp.]|nr:GNAT family N-acetyltransferase [Fermentimonas sp.]MBF6598352.1 GNAT family N-acetyltransferase [Fermentimonas sp.]